jgi:diguanylate cyclase (GGDEF)-like protein
MKSTRVRQPAILPRDRHAASRAASYFMLVGSVFILVMSILMPGYNGPNLFTAIATYGTGVVLGSLGLVCRCWPEVLPDAFWIAVPVGCIAMIGGLDYVTSDVSAGGHLFFLWPTLYAATFLRRRLVCMVLGCAFVTDFALSCSLTTLAQATYDIVCLVIAVSLASIIIGTLRTRVGALLGELESQALQDTLTGLANRRAFDRDIVQAIALAERTGKPLSLLNLDVDNFKSINDKWGHTAGDQALLALARALRKATRESDIAARLGGDEFVVLLTDCDSEGSLIAARELQKALKETWDLPGEPATLSIGAATLPDDATTLETLMAEADAAMYSAKAGGRNQVVSASGRSAQEGRGPSSRVTLL